ncbi:hypothetical protein [Chitinophaga sp.]
MQKTTENKIMMPLQHDLTPAMKINSTYQKTIFQYFFKELRVYQMSPKE